MTPAERWVEEASRTTKPDRIVWCDGSDGENGRLIEEMLKDGTLEKLHPGAAPGSYLHRSHPSDVARTEHLTFICSPSRDDAGPTNNWMAPDEAKARVAPLFDGVMKGRTMYVVPYVMGPLGSPFSKVGIEVTDSPYVVANMRIMTRMGKAALDQLGGGDEFVPGLHSVGDLSPERRYILHFPEERLIWSVGSGYGGNALLGKKCFALRIASTMARRQGWMAEHMLILELSLPSGEVHYVAAAFPSACGKTNLAMLVSPLEHLGYKVRTIGDDIAWLRPGPDGRLWAVNPEAGFFGVVPGTGPDTNPNAMATIARDTIFTNVAVTTDGVPWWEGKDKHPPENLIDWQGRPWDRQGKAAHPNSRFTVAARQCPSMSPRWEDAQGVPISAVVFGGRRARVAPLVFQAFDWGHGVFVAATMGSETTAAATGKVGVVRRDPMAMLPFCGYNMADYFGHWLKMGRAVSRPPAIFHVNWFRQDASGRFLWPGFGQNLRVLLWMIDRIQGRGSAVETPVGLVPAPDAFNLDGLDMPRATLEELLRVDRDEWAEEVPEIRAFFERFGARLPEDLSRSLDKLAQRLGVTASA
ncbi:MAG TPA: phosphoenolpyruvate carboxykinase (GTP) [Vicinamibacteria bacterium]|nr:phosphoenolpyruvate carboxykinase (GTP) [Vicinamibacteria bacterium]